MPDDTRPNRAANMEKAEGDRWQSESDTVERRDREGVPSPDEAGGITNRPRKEEIENQEAVPDRGHTRDERGSDEGQSPD